MLLDFSPIRNGQIKIGDFALTVDPTRLAEYTNASINRYRDAIAGLTDAQVTFIPQDPSAEGGIGWNVAHLLLHTTASAEEGAAISSILARGVGYPFEPRLRYEPEWTTFTTVRQCFQRLEESRRIRLSYLASWPERPFFDTYRILPEPAAERFGQINAVGSFLLGLSHEDGHFAQFTEAVRQATAVANPVSG
jgi:hypothetical protein